MYLLAKLFNWLFLSPVIFLVLIGTAGFFIYKNKKNTALITLGLLFLLVYMLSLRPVRDLFLLPLENKYPAQNFQKLNCDILVVNGGGVFNRTPDKNGPSLTNSSLRRTLAAYQIWRYKKTPILVCGGTPLATQRPEAIVMAEFLAEMGVPKSYILKDTQSKNTFENIAFIKSYLVKNNYQKIGLITSAIHLPRSVAVAKHFKLKVLPVPVDYRVDRCCYSWADLFPDANHLAAVFDALHEYIGVLFYRLRYSV